jgi:hypothetical protein
MQQSLLRLYKQKGDESETNLRFTLIIYYITTVGLSVIIEMLYP